MENSGPVEQLVRVKPVTAHPLTLARCDCGQFDLSGSDSYVGTVAVVIEQMTECYTDEQGRRRHSYSFRRQDEGPQALRSCDSYWFTICPVEPYGTVARSAQYRREQR